ncbi:MAG: Hpt domain-containing protein, partial [Magnetococcales bacterium]|nr:Hpt domain-containing protein [Magnetococcales bacterium]
MHNEHKKNEIVLQKLLDIRKNWLKNLPEKIQKINASWNRLKNEVWDDSLFNKFHRQVHTIAGSGGTFGFPEIGLS